MNEAMNTRNAQLMAMLGLTAVVFGVFLYAEGIGSALAASWRSCCPAGGS
jgi:hypothetical protein